MQDIEVGLAKSVDDEALKLDRNIGARLRLARKSSGMTQAALGSKIGVSFTQLQKYEQGAHRISAAALIRCARILNISPLELLGLDAQDGEPRDCRFLSADTEALLRAYNAINSPHLKRVVRELARSLTEGDAP